MSEVWFCYYTSRTAPRLLGQAPFQAIHDSASISHAEPELIGSAKNSLDIPSAQALRKRHSFLCISFFPYQSAC